MLFIGKVSGINTSDGRLNLLVVDKDKNQMNLKVSGDVDIVLGHVYAFEYDEVLGKERTSYPVKSFKEVTDLPLTLMDETLRNFYKAAPITLEYAEEEIQKYLASIENDNIKKVTEFLIFHHHDKFFTYPAASKMHHAYVGGLAYHSIGMLHMADSFIENYPYLNKDYVYAGIMLHDIGKSIELTGCVDTAYSLEGQLLGHLVLGAMEIERAAEKLGIANTKEILYLEHMLISHHGLPQFGAAKKPMTAEALCLWHIDTIDSKFRVLGEELEKIESESYTEPIGVLDRAKIWKI
jgi:3'-5' exoribonuclease